MVDHYAYYFYRVNPETSKDELLQFFFDYDLGNECEKYWQFFIRDIQNDYGFQQIIRNS